MIAGTAGDAVTQVPPKTHSVAVCGQVLGIFLTPTVSFFFSFVTWGEVLLSEQCFQV